MHWPYCPNNLFLEHGQLWTLEKTVLQSWNIFQDWLTGDPSLSLHIPFHSAASKNRWPPGVIAQLLCTFVPNFKCRDLPWATKQATEKSTASARLPQRFNLICWAVAINHLQCCEKGTSSSTKGSKSCRWDIIYCTVSCRSRRWPREWPSNWSPRALNRQFLQNVKTMTAVSPNDFKIK